MTKREKIEKQLERYEAQAEARGVDAADMLAGYRGACAALVADGTVTLREMLVLLGAKGVLR